MRGRIIGMGANQRYEINGREVTKKEFERAFPPKPLGGGECLRGWTRPIESDALAVHPEQIPEVMERNRKHGLHVEYNQEDGRPKLRDRGMRRELLKLDGLFDKDGGYGDG